MQMTVQLSLTPEDLNVVLLALGQLPYVKVHELIGRIQSEVGPQLLAMKAKNADDTEDATPSR